MEIEENIDSDLTSEREKIRANLSQMSFEEIMKLKEKMGARLYNETIFGESSKKRKQTPRTEFKRENKNRPREMSSKRPMRLESNIAKKPEPRDPRFDPLCGTFNEEVFKKSYKFINNIKLNERQLLKQELKDTEDPKKQKKIKYLIQRLDNQLREKDRKDKELKREKEEKREIKEKLKKGEKPEFQKKSEKKIINLLNQYEELKQTNKLKKHIEKKSKKVARKDFKKMRETFN